MRRWFQRLRRRRRLEQDLAAELEAHLDMRAEMNRATGMSAVEAAVAARRAFGHIQSIKEACRDQRHLGWIEDAWHDLRRAARSLRRAPGFVAGTLAILALSVAAVAIVSMYYAGFVLSDPPYLRDPDRVVALLVRGKQQTAGERPVSMKDFEEWRERLTQFDSLAAYLPLGGPVSGGGKHDFASGLGVSGNFFEILGVQPVLGRSLIPADYEAKAPRVIVISHHFWQERFGGSADVLGRQLVFYRTPSTIVGVMPPGFDFPDRADYWVPTDRSVTSLEHGAVRRTLIFGRLHQGVSLATAGAQAATVVGTSASSPQTAGAQRTAAIVPLRDRFNASFAQQAPRFLALALAVQVLAALNIAGLFFARNLTLVPQRALKAALGASRSRLLREAMTEAVLLAAVGVLAGTALAWTARSAILSALAPEWPFPTWWHFDLSVPVLGFTAAAAMLTVVGFALIPMWRSTGLALDRNVRAVNASHGGHRAGRRLRSLGVGIQFAAALALLIGAGLAVQNVRALRRIPLGIDPTGVAWLTVANLDLTEPGGERFLQTILDGAADVPGVTAAGMALDMPGASSSETQSVDIQTPDERSTIDGVVIRSITAGMLDVFRLPLLQGRAFSSTDEAGASPVVLIDRTFADKAFPGVDPIGRRISTSHSGESPAWATIVGIVGPTRQNSFRAPNPTIYRPLFAQSRLNNGSLYVRTQGDPASVLDDLSRIARAAAPRVSVLQILDGRYATMVRSIYWKSRFFGDVMTGFSGLAFVIAAVGIYGLIAYNVAQRIHEIGVRLALGATPQRVVAEFVIWGLKTVGLSVIAGTGSALLASGWFTRSFAVHGFVTSAGDNVLAYAAALFLMLTAALLACWIPARRAADVQPMQALNEE